MRDEKVTRAAAPTQWRRRLITNRQSPSGHAAIVVGLSFSLAEMSPALPHTGGAYSFARTTMGPWGGFITGLAESIEYVMTPAVIVFFIGSYLTGISYTLQGLSFILLRVKLPDIARPYRSPFGMTGAALTVVIALWTMYYQFRDPAYVKGVYAALAWYVAGLAYFGLFGRHRLVLSPEEQFAISKGTPVEEEAETGEPVAAAPSTSA